MVDRHGENGDASFYDEDCLQRRRSYKEDENDPCFSLCINYAHSHFHLAMKEAVSPTVCIKSMGCVLLGFSIFSKMDLPKSVTQVCGFTQRHSYKEDENDPCFSLCINYAHSHFPLAMKEVVSPKVCIKSMGCVLLSFPVLSRLMHLVLNEEA